MTPHHATGHPADVPCCGPPARRPFFYPASCGFTPPSKSTAIGCARRGAPRGLLQQYAFCCNKKNLPYLAHRARLKCHYVRSRVHNLCSCGLYSSLSIGIGYVQLPKRRGCCALRISCHARLHVHRPHGLHRLPFRGQECRIQMPADRRSPTKSITWVCAAPFTRSLRCSYANSRDLAVPKAQKS